MRGPFLLPVRFPDPSIRFGMRLCVACRKAGVDAGDCLRGAAKPQKRRALFPFAVISPELALIHPHLSR
jgi:hypothetical protein